MSDIPQNGTSRPAAALAEFVSEMEIGNDEPSLQFMKKCKPPSRRTFSAIYIWPGNMPAHGSEEIIACYILASIGIGAADVANVNSEICSRLVWSAGLAASCAERQPGVRHCRNQRLESHQRPHHRLHSQRSGRPQERVGSGFPEAMSRAPLPIGRAFLSGRDSASLGPRKFTKSTITARRSSAPTRSIYTRPAGSKCADGAFATSTSISCSGARTSESLNVLSPAQEAVMLVRMIVALQKRNASNCRHQLLDCFDSELLPNRCGA